MHWKIRFFFNFPIVPGIVPGRVLDGRYDGTHIDRDAILSEKHDVFCHRYHVVTMKYGPKFALHYTKLLRKNGQWGGGKRGGVFHI